MPYPSWVRNPKLSEADRESARLNYLFRLAALNHNPEGSLPALAEALGVSRETLYSSIREGRVSGLLATAVEHLVGPSVVSRLDLCTEILQPVSTDKLSCNTPTV